MHARTPDGHVSAVNKGTVRKRIERRITGKATGRWKAVQVGAARATGLNSGGLPV